MIFCHYNRDWLYRRGFRYLLSQRRRERKGRSIKRYCLYKKHMPPLRSLRLCEKTVC